MNYSKRKYTFSVGALLIAMNLSGLNSLLGQDFTPTVKWSGDIRVRSEVDMRDFDMQTAANTYTLLRTRAGLEALPLENVRAVIQIQDSRVFGQEKDAAGSFNTLADTRNLDLHQGYLEVKKLCADWLSIRLGRMEVAFANERLFGAVGWHNVGRSFDGGMFKVDVPSMSLDLFALNLGEVQNYTPVATPTAVRYTRDLGHDLYGAYATFKNLAQQRLDGYYIYQVDRNQTVPGKRDLRRSTFGSYFKGKSDAFDYEAEVAYQTGSRRGMDVSAYMLTGAVGYSIPGATLSRIGAGYELHSGTATGDTKYKTFDPLYGTNHKFYGFMDYFIAIPANTLDRGLTDLIARATLNLGEKVTTNLWFHHFAFAQEVNTLKALGQEIDVVTQYKYNKNVSFECGVSAFIPDELMRLRFGGADVALWGYLTAQVSF